MSKTFIERIRHMLRAAGLPKSFYVEVAKTTCFVAN